MSSDLALAVRGLVCTYGEVVAVRNVSMDIQPGQVTALLGANGAGKTTILNALSGRQAAEAVSIELFGEPIGGLPSHKRARLGLCHVPQGRGVFRSLTVEENLSLDAMKGERSDAIERATSAFPVLRDRLRQQAGTMSGGEQQMLALAVAYVARPRLVLVDEPSLGLAPILVEEIFASLARLADEGVALLVVDQFASRVLELATQAYVVRKGEISFQGPAQELAGADLLGYYFGIN
jgi:branched-chain amino acid transport system ATP-binding protein